MKIFNRAWAVVLVVFGLVGITGPNTAHAALAPGFLGALESFSVFGAAGITGGALSDVWGDVGENAFGDGSISGQQAGTYYPAASTTLVGDRTSAYGDLVAEALTGSVTLSTVTSVGPGVYAVTASGFSELLTLTGAGTYVFKRASDIAQTAGGTMLLTGGACASDVYWQTGTGMTFAAGGNIEGTIIAETAITFADSSLTFKGRALSDTAVALGGITITEPTTCAGGGGSGLPAPLIHVTKIPTPLVLPSGPGSVTYNYVVTNIGDVDMLDIEVTDDECLDVDFVSGDVDGDKELDLEEVWKYRCVDLLEETTTNTVTAKGKSNGRVVIDTASATVVVSDDIVPPLINIVKVPNIFLLPAGGGAVTYNYTVTNPGTEPLNNVSVTDDKCTGLPGRVVGHPGDLNKNNLLESNESWSFTCLTNLSQTTTNIGRAEGHANGLTAIDFSPATVVVAPPVVVAPLIIPTLPNTGFPPVESDTVMLIAILVIVSATLLIELKKPKI